MPSIGSLTRQKPVETIIDLGDGDAVAVVFDRNRITPFWVADAQRRENESDALTLPKALADVMISWDVTADDQGGAFPPTPENIGVLSVSAQGALLEQIMRAAVPSDAEGKASSGTPSIPNTSSLERPALLQNGQPTSPSPSASTSPSPT